MKQKQTLDELCDAFGVNEWFAALCSRCRWMLFVRLGQGTHDCACQCHLKTQGWSRPLNHGSTERSRRRSQL